MQRFRLTWAQLTKDGYPFLYVLRPYGRFISSEVGEEYEYSKNRFELARVKILYEHRYIGTEEELLRTQLQKEAA